MKNIDVNTKIGVVGFGHLGSSIVKALLDGGFSKANLMISYRGSSSTYEKAVAMGVESSLRDTSSLMQSADIVILAAKPQDFSSISSNSVKPNALIMSFMAAIPFDILKKTFGCRVCRAMCSGPETITAGHGVSVLYPEAERAKDVLSLAGITLLSISAERELDAFTVGICIPPILMNIEVQEEKRTEALSEMAKSYPVYTELTKWIERELAPNVSEAESCLENVSTKGGISEAMTIRLRADGNFAAALERGMVRCLEICRDICSAIEVNAA
ncbi:MAG: NAD(P)-binding domain-containing protein [Synergistaceae bacterium]